MTRRKPPTPARPEGLSLRSASLLRWSPATPNDAAFLARVLNLADAERIAPTAAAIASQLGMSQNAVSRRIRRLTGGVVDGRAYVGRPEAGLWAKTARPERVRFLVPVKQTTEGAVLLWDRDPDCAFRKGEVDGFAVLPPALKGTAPPPTPQQSRAMSTKQWHRAQAPARWSRIALVEVDPRIAASRQASRAGAPRLQILPPEAAPGDAVEPGFTPEPARSARGDSAGSCESLVSVICSGGRLPPSVAGGQPSRWPR